MEEDVIRVAIFGTGAVGGYFGARLAQAGADVVFIARGKQLRAFQEEGLRLTSPLGDWRGNIRVSDKAQELGGVDAVLVCVKSWHLPEAITAIPGLLKPETVVVPLLNQVDAPEQLAAGLDAHHVAGGLCKILAQVDEPGHIHHLSFMPYIAFNELDGNTSDRITRLARTFAAASGLKVETPSAIRAAMWEKAMFVASLGGVGAVSRAPAGVIRQIPETRELLERAMNEILAVARAQTIDLDAAAVARSLALVDGLKPEATASMQRDIIEGRPSELEAQCGTIARLGRELNVPTPVHDFIYRALLPTEYRARGKFQFGEDP